MLLKKSIQKHIKGLKEFVFAVKPLLPTSVQGEKNCYQCIREARL